MLFILMNPVLGGYSSLLKLIICSLALSRATGDTVIQYGDTECDTVIHIR